MRTLPLILSVVFFMVGGRNLQAEDEFSVEDLKFFENRIRPLLVERCLKCHTEEKQSGGLRLDGRTALLTGGDSGPAIVPHSPDESLLIEAVRWESYEMPPDGQLPDEEIELLTEWVRRGAYWPGKDVTASVRPALSKISEEDRQFWSFRPLRRPAVPQTAVDEWCRNEIDAFIHRRLKKESLSPAPIADPEALIRRVTFDLTGLPPNRDDVAAFVQDPTPERYREIVDRLLESPRYGEHWARFWLDLVRYAESDGFRKDDYRPSAWRYRDYVIDSFNADKPYDRFMMEQIAGDEIAPHDPDALTATGFLRHGIYEYNQRDARTQWQDMLNDITDTTGDVFLGLGMGCARCHDHKFDPILQRDYFRLQAFFSNLSMPNDTPLVTPSVKQAYEQQLRRWEEATAEIRDQIDELEQPRLEKLAHGVIKMFPEDIQEIVAKPKHERSSYEQQLAHLVHLQVLDKQKRLAGQFKGDDKTRWEALKKELAAFDTMKPEPLPVGMTATDYGQTAPVVFIPGKERLGEIEPGFLTIFEPDPADILPPPKEVNTSGLRTTLAKWFARPDHPLTTRVIVNRIWQQHFGTGLVATPSDFGHLGEAPSHPELLDWLATSFVEHGWSFKWLHRQIVTSATYQQSSLRSDPKAEQVDPANRLLWRGTVRRLEAEQIRDALLAVSGELDLGNVGGASATPAKSKRRSIYNRVMRNTPDPVLRAFDFPDRMSSVGQRNVTTTPSQSLLMINGDWMTERARAFARRVVKECEGGAESKVRHAIELAYGRAAGTDEIDLLTSYLEAADARQPGLAIAPINQTEVGGIEITAAEGFEPLDAAEKSSLPKQDFTVEATVELRSLFPDAAVRTIISQWDSSTKHPGWALGVTSTKSAYKPRNLILQLVGQNEKDALTYEVIPSNIRLQLDRPYRVAVSVNLDDLSESGIQFVVTDLISGETKTAGATHQVTSGYTNEHALRIGGRFSSSGHRWDGWIGRVRLVPRSTPVEQLKSSDVLAHAELSWSFVPGTAGDEAHIDGPELLKNGLDDSITPALVDLCHVLLNSNEMLYVD